MVVVYSVTPELRIKLKAPFGKLIHGTFAKTMFELKRLVAKEKPALVVGVGDTVSRNLVAFDIPARLLVTDNVCRRRSVAPAVFGEWRVVHVCNPAGVITEEAAVAVRNALEGSERVHLIVDGEEDLLVLVAVLYAPLGALVVYGQPGEGLVVVRVTDSKRGEALGLLKAMESVRKAK